MRARCCATQALHCVFTVFTSSSTTIAATAALSLEGVLRLSATDVAAAHASTYGSVVS
jgi:hypothetical protein